LELLKAARRGVKVRVIVDQITVAEDPALLARLAVAHVNLEIGFYNPTVYRGQTTPFTVATGTLFSFRKTNQRMHNKVFVVDGKIGIVGGRNIENKYFDFNPAYTFKDRDFIIMGPAVKQMDESFNRYWNDKIVVKLAYLIDVGAEVLTIGRSDQSTFIEGPDYSFFSDIEGKFDSYSLFSDRPSARPVSSGRVVFIADLPGKPSKAELKGHEDSTITMREVWACTKSITIQTPYLVSVVRHQYRRWGKSVEVTISTNSLAATDLNMIYAMTFKQKRKIIKDLQADLFEFKPFPADAAQYIPRYERLVAARGEIGNETPGGQVPVLTGAHTGPRFGMHAKSIVVDNSIALIGSHNLTPRSVNINTEVVAIIWDEKIAKRLEENILRDTEPQTTGYYSTAAEPFVSHLVILWGHYRQCFRFSISGPSTTSNLN
jgi:phosphatidylserine/phosphatidylglycerophosphate/cardiolipin synthase-like enzyme